MKLMPLTGNPRVDAYSNRLDDEFRTRQEQDQALLSSMAIPTRMATPSLARPANLALPGSKTFRTSMLDLAGGPADDINVISDTGRSLYAGTVGLISGLAALAEINGAVSPGALTQPLNEYTAEIVQSMSPAAQAELQRKWADMSDAGVLRNPKAAWLQLMQQVPQLALAYATSAASAGVAARGLTGAAASRAAMLGGAAGGGLQEGILTSGDAANTVISDIMQRQDLTPEQKQAAVAKVAASGHIGDAGVMAALTGAPAGALIGSMTRGFGPALNRAGRLGRGATFGTGEALQESAQEGYQAVQENLAARESYDPARDPYAGLTERMAAGAGLGFVSGGALGMLHPNVVDPDIAAALVSGEAENTQQPPAAPPPSGAAPGPIVGAPGEQLSLDLQGGQMAPLAEPHQLGLPLDEVAQPSRAGPYAPGPKQLSLPFNQQVPSLDDAIEAITGLHAGNQRLVRVPPGVMEDPKSRNRMKEFLTERSDLTDMTYGDTPFVRDPRTGDYLFSLDQNLLARISGQPAATEAQIEAHNRFNRQLDADEAARTALSPAQQTRVTELRRQLAVVDTQLGREDFTGPARDAAVALRQRIEKILQTVERGSQGQPATRTYAPGDVARIKDYDEFDRSNWTAPPTFPQSPTSALGPASTSWRQDYVGAPMPQLPTGAPQEPAAAPAQYQGELDFTGTEAPVAEPKKQSAIPTDEEPLVGRPSPGLTGRLVNGEWVKQKTGARETPVEVARGEAIDKALRHAFLLTEQLRLDLRGRSREEVEADRQTVREMPEGRLVDRLQRKVAKKPTGRLKRKLARAEQALSAAEDLVVAPAWAPSGKEPTQHTYRTRGKLNRRLKRGWMSRVQKGKRKLAPSHTGSEVRTITNAEREQMAARHEAEAARNEQVEEFKFNERQQWLFPEDQEVADEKAAAVRERAKKIAIARKSLQRRPSVPDAVATASRQSQAESTAVAKGHVAYTPKESPKALNETLRREVLQHFQSMLDAIADDAAPAERQKLADEAFNRTVKKFKLDALRTGTLSKVKSGKMSWDDALTENFNKNTAIKFLAQLRGVTMYDATAQVNDHLRYLKERSEWKAGEPEPNTSSIQSDAPVADIVNRLLVGKEPVTYAELNAFIERDREAEARADAAHPKRRGTLDEEQDETDEDTEQAPPDAAEREGVPRKLTGNEQPGVEEESTTEEVMDRAERESKLRRGRKAKEVVHEAVEQAEEEPQDETDHSGSEQAGISGTGATPSTRREPGGVVHFTRIGDETPRRVHEGSHPAAVSQPFSYQVDAANMMLDRIENNPGGTETLFADDPGMGKTMAMMLAALYYVQQGKPVLIVGENLADKIVPFVREAQRLGRLDLLKKIYFATYAGKAKGVEDKFFKYSDRDIENITSSEGERKAKPTVETARPKGGFHVAFMDEAHALKRYGGKFAETFRALGALHKIYTTATPADNYGSMGLLASINGQTLSQFLAAHGAVVDELQNGEVMVRAQEGHSYASIRLALAKTFKKLAGQYAFIRRQLPVDVERVEQAVGAAEQERHPEFAQLLREQQAVSAAYAAADSREGREGTDIKNRAMTQLIGLDENLKAQAVVDRTLSEIKEGRKVVILLERSREGGASDQTLRMLGQTQQVDTSMDFIKAALEKAGVRVGVYMSGGGSTNLEAIRKSFQTGDTQVLLSSRQQAGQSIDLDDQVGNAPRTLILVSPPWSYSQLQQAERRVARASTKSKARIVRMTMNSISDIQRTNKLLTKEDVASVLDNPDIVIEQRGRLARSFDDIVKVSPTGDSQMVTVRTSEPSLREDLVNVLNGMRGEKVQKSSGLAQWYVPNEHWGDVQKRLQDVYIAHGGEVAGQPSPKKGLKNKKGPAGVTGVAMKQLFEGHMPRFAQAVHGVDQMGAYEFLTALRRDTPRYAKPTTLDRILDRLIESVKTADLRVDFTMGEERNAEGQIVDGRYWPVENIVRIARYRLPVYGIAQMGVHEVVHALTYFKMRTDKAFREAMEQLANEALAVARKRGLEHMYGFKDVDEFVAEAFSNPAFQRFLNGIGGAPSLLQRAWNWIKTKVLGMKPLPRMREWRMLDEVLNLAMKNFEPAPEDRRVREVLHHLEYLPGPEGRFDAAMDAAYEGSKEWALESLLPRVKRAPKTTAGGLLRGALGFANISQLDYLFSDPALHGDTFHQYNDDGTVTRPITTYRYNLAKLTSYVSRYLALAQNVWREIHTDLRDLPATTRLEAFRHFMNTTVQGVWPESPFDDPGGKNHHLVYLRSKDDNGNWNKRSNDDIAEMQKRYDAVVAEHKRLAQISAKIPKVYRDLTKFYEDEWNSTTFQLLRNVLYGFDFRVTGATGKFEDSRVPTNAEKDQLARNLLAGQRLGKDLDMIRVPNEKGTDWDEKTTEAMQEDIGEIVNRAKLDGPYIGARRRGDYVLDATRNERTVRVDNATIDLPVIVKAVTEKYDDPVKRAAALEKEVRAALKRELRKRVHALKLSDPTLDVDSVNDKAIHMADDVAGGQHYAEIGYRDRIFQLHETLGQQDEARKELQADNWKVETGTLTSYFQGAQGGNATVLRNRILARLPEDKPMLRNAINAAMIDLMSETSIRKAERRFKRVPGYSLDLPRNFAEHAAMASHYKSQLEYGNALDQAMEDLIRLKDETQTRSAVGRTKEELDRAAKQSNLVSAVVDEIKKHRQVQALPYTKNIFTDNVSDLGALIYLTGTSYWMIQGTQQIMYGIPTLWKLMHGRAKSARTSSAAKYLLLASKGVTPWAWERARRIKFGFGWWKAADQTALDFLKPGSTFDSLASRAELNDQIAATIKQSDLPYKDGIVDMLETLGERNVLTMGLHTDIRSAARTGARNAVSEFVMGWVRAMPQITEMAGRSRVAIAAYIMARDTTKYTADPAKAHADALDIAEQAVAQSMFVYDTADRNRYMSGKQPGFGPLSRIVFQFRMHSQNVYALMLREGYALMKASTPERRWQAFKQLSGVFLTHLAAAGVIGATFEPIQWAFATLLAMMQSFGDEPPEPYEYWLERKANEMFGQEIGGALTKGLLYQVGVDVHSRMNLNHLFFNNNVYANTLEGREAAGQLLLTAAGPMGGFLGNMYEANRNLDDGNIEKAIENVAPRQFRDVTKVYRLATEGLRDTSGANVAARPVDLIDLMTTGLGFRTKNEERTATRKGIIYNLQNYYTKERGDTLSRASRALRRGDVVEADEIRRDYNAHVPQEFQLAPKDLRLAQRKQLKKERAVARDSVYIPPKQRRALLPAIKHLQE